MYREVVAVWWTFVIETWYRVKSFFADDTAAAAHRIFYLSNYFYCLCTTFNYCKKFHGKLFDASFIVI